MAEMICLQQGNRCRFNDIAAGAERPARTVVSAALPVLRCRGSDRLPAAPRSRGVGESPVATIVIGNSGLPIVVVSRHRSTSR